MFELLKKITITSSNFAKKFGYKGLIYDGRNHTQSTGFSLTFLSF